MSITERTLRSTVAVCALDDLVEGRGVAALVGTAQVAIFRVEDDDGMRLLAVDHRDPIGGANVLARGIVGHDGEHWYVASPLLKHRFDLETGACLDDPTAGVRTWATTVIAGVVHVGG